MAVGMGAAVTILDELSAESDRIIGAVLVAGAAAPKLVTAQNVKDMNAGAVPRTSMFALTNATLPFVKSLAKHGWLDALKVA